MKRTITNSMRCTFLDCNYKFFLEYMRRLTPIREATYFRWGRLVHAGTECQDNNEPTENAAAELRAEVEARYTRPEVVTEIDEMCNLLPTVLDAYLLKWHADDENYEILGGESHGGKFSLDLPCGWCFQGKIDKIVRDIRSGKILTWERKTPGSVDDMYFEDVLLDSQPKGYLLAAQYCYGFDARDVLYDIIQKPQIKEKKTETREQFLKRLGEEYLLNRDRYFTRRRMPFDQREIDAYFWEIDQVAQMMEWHIREGIYPKHHPRNRIGSCAYRSICLNNDESKFYVRDMDDYCPELI